jgi:hypothetical protein
MSRYRWLGLLLVIAFVLPLLLGFLASTSF